MSHHREAVKLLDSIFASDNLKELYDNTRLNEANNHVILKQLDEEHPHLLKKDNIAGVLEAARKKVTSDKQ